MSNQQHFCLKWNNHTNNLMKVFTELFDDQHFVDVTLACEGSMIKAHKIVLSACSTYFKDLLLANPCKHPIVILKDIKFQDLKAIVNFMYYGEVNVSQSQIGGLLKTAETLQIKGLTQINNDEQNENQSPKLDNQSQNNSGQKQDVLSTSSSSSSSSSSCSKRKRRKRANRPKSEESGDESSQSSDNSEQTPVKRLNIGNNDITSNDSQNSNLVRTVQVKKKLTLQSEIKIKNENCENDTTELNVSF